MIFIVRNGTAWSYIVKQLQIPIYATDTGVNHVYCLASCRVVPGQGKLWGLFRKKNPLLKATLHENIYIIIRVFNFGHSFIDQQTVQYQ